MTVLLIDDNKDWLYFWKVWLTEEGLQVVICVSGADLHELVVVENPDIIVTDVLMGEVSGEVLCRELKAHERSMHIPVVLFSSHRRIDEIASQCNADGFISKNVTPAELTGFLRKYVNV